ncbi:MAG TPA: ATP synthase F1 subunit epsilon [Candidatus Dormibacteraeota bacterium]|nr:ATP synthase F1 subunit epsilon [Candidatus Dormibacteraeota bacterium]
MGVPTRLLTSQKPLFDGDCDFIVLRGADGDLGVLPGHAPLLTWLKPGEVMLRRGEREEYFFLEDGYLEVLPDRVSILAQRGDRSDAIDPAEAEGQRRAAEEALSRASGSSEQEVFALEGELAVAAARMEAVDRQRHRARD